MNTKNENDDERRKRRNKLKIAVGRRWHCHCQQSKCVQYYCWTIAFVLFIISFEMEFGNSSNRMAACKLAYIRAM